MGGEQASRLRRIRIRRRCAEPAGRTLPGAFGYNIAAVPPARPPLGFLNPLIAAAAMTMSSVLVVANSLRLRRFRAGDRTRLGPRSGPGVP